MEDNERSTPEAIALNLEGMIELYDRSPQLIEGVPQRVKVYPDGTRVIISRYNSIEHGGTEQELDTFDVGVYHDNEGALFLVTQNGLVTVSTGRRQTVSLRSHLYPRPTDNLRIRFNDETEETKLRTPLQAFRAAEIY